jgi:hypothetical protein
LDSEVPFNKVRQVRKNSTGKVKMESRLDRGSFFRTFAEVGKRTSPSDESTLNPTSARSKRIQSTLLRRNQRSRNPAPNQAGFFGDPSASHVLDANPNRPDLKTLIGRAPKLLDGNGGAAAANGLQERHFDVPHP